MCRLFIAAIAVLVSSTALAEEIPLKSVWALGMPGTRDLKEFDDSEAQEKIIQPLLNHIRESWNNDHGVAVQGEGLEALQHFIRIEMEGEKPDLLSPDASISLVFFTKHAGLFVHLQSVEQQGNRFTIRYSLVPHRTREATQHLALIPVGRLPPGKYVVKIEQLPMEKKYQEAGYPERMPEQGKNVCDSFSFTVHDPPEPVANEDPIAERIPLDRIWALDMPGTQDVRKLDPRETTEETAITKIGNALMMRTEEREYAGPCFLVVGEGKVALQNAVDVIAGGTSPAKSLPADEDVSLVFYSHAAPGYVHLHSVRHSKDQVTVRYQVRIHQSSEVTVHFALIPLGKLSPGKVKVEAVEVASDTPYTNHALTDRAACDSCSFVIGDQSSPE